MGRVGGNDGFRLLKVGDIVVSRVPGERMFRGYLSVVLTAYICMGPLAKTPYFLQSQKSTSATRSVSTHKVFVACAVRENNLLMLSKQHSHEAQTLHISFIRRQSLRTHISASRCWNVGGPGNGVKLVLT